MGILRNGSVATQQTTYFSAFVGSNECHDWQIWYTADFSCCVHVL